MPYGMHLSPIISTGQGNRTPDARVPTKAASPAVNKSVLSVLADVPQEAKTLLVPEAGALLASSEAHAGAEDQGTR